jgi:hypothetical protein
MFTGLACFSRFGCGFNRRWQFQLGLFRRAMVAMVQRLDARSLFFHPQLSVSKFSGVDDSRLQSYALFTSGERGSSNHAALRSALGLHNRIRFIAALILRPVTSRNMRSIGVSRRGLRSRR